MKAKKQILLFIISALTFVVISILLYAFITRKIPGADVNMVAREIETTDKLWLNGYLGHFFRLNYFTLFNWLLIPILFYDFIKIKQATLSKKIFLFVYIFCLILIGAKGFFNSRYSLTLYPISIVYLITWLAHFFKLKKWNVFSKAMPYFIIVLGFLWYCNEIFVWKVKHKTKEVVKVEYKTAQGYNELRKIDSPFFITRFINAIVKDEYPNYRLGKDNGVSYQSFPQFDIYDEVIKQTSKLKSKVLVNNMPAIFYHTNIEGVYYWAGDDLIFDDKGRHPLFKGRTPDEVKEYLKEDLQVGFIFTSETYNQYLPEFHQFLIEHCTLIKEGKYAYQFFQIN